MRRSNSSRGTVVPEAPADATAERRILAPDADAPKLHKVLAQAGVGSRRDMDRFNVDYSQEGNNVRVSGRGEKKYFQLWNNNGLSVRYELRVPKQYNLRVSTAGGNVVLTGPAKQLIEDPMVRKAYLGEN